MQVGREGLHRRAEDFRGKHWAPLLGLGNTMMRVGCQCSFCPPPQEQCNATDPTVCLAPHLAVVQQQAKQQKEKWPKGNNQNSFFLLHNQTLKSVLFIFHFSGAQRHARLGVCIVLHILLSDQNASRNGQNKEEERKYNKNEIQSDQISDTHSILGCCSRCGWGFVVEVKPCRPLYGGISFLSQEAGR